MGLEGEIKQVAAICHIGGVQGVFSISHAKLRNTECDSRKRYSSTYLRKNVGEKTDEGKKLIFQGSMSFCFVKDFFIALDKMLGVKVGGVIACYPCCRRSGAVAKLSVPEGEEQEDL